MAACMEYNVSRPLVLPELTGHNITMLKGGIIDKDEDVVLEKLNFVTKAAVGKLSNLSRRVGATDV